MRLATFFSVPAQRIRVNWALLFGGVGIAAALAAVVYHDARRVSVRRPRLLAAAVFASLGGAATLSAAVPSIPPAGLLVVALIGPVVYLFEREDARRGEERLDPYSLPSGENDEEKREE